MGQTANTRITRTVNHFVIYKDKRIFQTMYILLGIINNPFIQSFSLAPGPNRRRDAGGSRMYRARRQVRSSVSVIDFPVRCHFQGRRVLCAVGVASSICQLVPAPRAIRRREAYSWGHQAIHSRLPAYYLARSSSIYLLNYTVLIVSINGEPRRRGPPPDRVRPRGGRPLRGGRAADGAAERGGGPPRGQREARRAPRHEGHPAARRAWRYICSSSIVQYVAMFNGRPT